MNQNDLQNAWQEFNRATHISPIRDEKHYTEMVGLADSLTGVIGSATKHPLLDLFDLVSELIRSVLIRLSPNDSTPRHFLPKSGTRAISACRKVAILASVGENTNPLWDRSQGLGANRISTIRSYDAEHYTVPDASPREVLRFLMDQHGLAQSDLPEVGNQSVISMLLSGTRQLNVRQIQALAARFHVSPTVFIEKTETLH